jgi:hypothetical protein
MSKAIKKFEPDALVLLSGPGALVGSMAMSTLGCFMPVYNILLEDKLGKSFKKAPKGYITATTDKWNIYVPRAIFDKDAYKKLLVFTDCDISGDTNKAVRNLLLKKGIENDNIYLTSLVCSKIAQSTKKEIVDDKWLLTDHTTFYFPWGEWY